MIETFAVNNRLYTKRANLRNWEYNLKTIQDQQFQQLLKARQEYIEVSPFLVMPDGLVIGGNSRNLADEHLKTEDEWIELIDFAQGPDGDTNWYVLSDGKLRTDKKAFPTKEEAMMTYSLIHNAQYAGIDTNKLANIVGIPQFADMDWSDFNNLVGQPVSLQDFIKENPVDLTVTAPDANPPGEPAQSEASPAGDPAPSESIEQPEKKTESNTPIMIVACPDCGCKFEAESHRVK